MVVVVDRHRAARQVPYRDCQPALELVIIIAVEQIVFAVVLVVQHGVGFGESRFEQAALRPALPAGTVGPAAPAEISVGQIGIVPPDPLVDQCLQTGAVGPWLRPEYPVSGAAGGLLGRGPFGFERGAVGGDASSRRVCRWRLVERSDGPHRAVE